MKRNSTSVPFTFSVTLFKIIQVVPIETSSTTGKKCQARKENSNLKLSPYVGKEHEKEWVCVTESLCCTAEINTTLQISYTSIKS